MEKPSTKQTIIQLLSLYEKIKEGAMNPDTLWRTVIYATLSLAVVVLVFAYTTYTWAIGVETPGIVIHASSSPLSLAEFENIISTYQATDEMHIKLTHSPPDAPSFNRGASAVLSPGVLDESQQQVLP